MKIEIAEPGIPRERVSTGAAAVVKRLQEAGYEAYLVGGCVRDLLLRRTPKDFDVATNAHPEAICAIFPRSRPIGRRFRIVHVRMRAEIIEVSTFRGTGAGEDGAGASFGRPREAGATNGRDREPRDAYGTIDEDAIRRDFTINALYYCPIADMLLDYCDGMADIAKRTLRLIGDPLVRYREDPVRILRAVRIAAKLDLRIHRATKAAIAPSKALLGTVSPARLFDEFCKLFLCGHGVYTFELLERQGLTEALFPLAVPPGPLLRAALESTDARLAEAKPVTPGFLLAALLWPDYLGEAAKVESLPPGKRGEAREQAALAALQRLRQTIAAPRRHTYFARDVWQLQPLLEREQSTADEAGAIIAHKRFRAAYDFLLLRADLGEVEAKLADWWTEAQIPGTDILKDLPAAPKRRRRRRVRGRGRRAALAGEAVQNAAPP